MRKYSINSPPLDDAQRIVQNLIQDRYIDEILGSDLRYCLEHRLSSKERWVVEHLVEGYSDREIYTLLKRVFPSFNAYNQVKKRAKKKLLQFLGL